MAVKKTIYRKINNNYFKGLCQSFKEVLKLDDNAIISSVKEASVDDNDKKNINYLYDGKIVDMDTIKLDDITLPFLKYMKTERKLEYFEQPKAVDAVCINKNNEWFIIEFKDCPMYKNNSKDNKLNSEVISSIRQKMFGSLWFLFTLDSFANNNLFDDDVTDFARTHITYIAVVSREKNPEEFRRIHESNGNLYTPYYLKKYVGYYFKDVYMFTENEFAKFIKDFHC